MQITLVCSTCKPEVEFQYGGRFFFENESSNISGCDGDMVTQFGAWTDFCL